MAAVLGAVPPLPAGALPPGAVLGPAGIGVPVAAGVHAAATALNAVSWRNRRREMICRTTSSIGNLLHVAGVDPARSGSRSASGESIRRPSPIEGVAVRGSSSNLQHPAPELCLGIHRV